MKNFNCSICAVRYECGLMCEKPEGDECPDYVRDMDAINHSLEREW